MIKKTLIIINSIVVLSFFGAEISSASDEYSKPQINDSYINNRIDALEKNLNILEKYVYSSRGNQFTENNNLSNEVSDGSTMTDEFSEQFKIIRGDIEKIQFEYTKMHSKFLQFYSDFDQRLNNIEESIKKDNYSKTKPKVDSAQLNNNIPNNHNIINQSNKKSLDKLPTNNATPNKIEEKKITPKESFNQAYASLKNNDFKTAKVKFEQFIKHNESSPLLGAAHYWLGEISGSEKNYEKAAAEYLKSYEINANSGQGKATESLFKLGQSFLMLNKKAEACVTFTTLLKKYPNAASNIKLQTEKYIKQSKCQ